MDTDCVLLLGIFLVNHPLWILYSSGTTGLPKGVVIPQSQIMGGALLLSLAGSVPVEVSRHDSRYPHSTTVIVVLPTGGVVDISYGYPLGFNRSVECALAIHAPQEWR